MSASNPQLVDEAARSIAARTPQSPSAEKERTPARSRHAKDKPPPKAAAKAVAKNTGKAPRANKREPVAADLMQSPAICCGVHDTLNEAARLMWEHDLGALPVVNQAREPVGMITDRDACMAAYTQGVALYHSAVTSAMSTQLVSCDVSAPVAEIRELMTRAQVRRLPVVDARGTLVGVVGLSDILKEAHASLPKDRRRGTSAPMLVRLVDAILQPARPDTAPESRREPIL